jgi:hypothetical protein
MATLRPKFVARADIRWVMLRRSPNATRKTA